jgi:hypothetical protein
MPTLNSLSALPAAANADGDSTETNCIANSSGALRQATVSTSVTRLAGQSPISPIGPVCAAAERGLSQPAASCSTFPPPAVLTPELPADMQALRSAFEEAAHAERNALRAVVRCGLLMLEAKKQAKRGEFGPWLQKHVFPDVQPTEFESKYWRRARRWIELTTDICARLGLLAGEKFAIPIRDAEFAANLPFSPRPQKDGTQEVSLADVLLLPSTVLPSGAREIQLKLFDLIDGKTHNQLSIELRSPYSKMEYHPRKATDEERLQAAQQIMEEQTKALTELILGYPVEKVPLVSRSTFRAFQQAVDGLRLQLKQTEK